MGDIRKRTATDGQPAYTARVRIKGAPPQSATFARSTDARKWIAATESAIRERRHFGRTNDKRRTVAEMIDKYVELVLPAKKSAANSIHQFYWWRDELGEYFIDDVTPSMIADCRDKLLSHTTHMGRKRTGASTNRYLATIRHAFNIAIRDWQWATDNPVSKIKKPSETRGRTRFLTDDERPRLLAACEASANPCLYTVVVLALSTGMRRGEIMGLHWKDIDFGRGEITLLETKSDEPRIVPFGGKALALLREHSKRRRIDTDLSFASPTKYGKDASPYDIQNAWDLAVKRAELENFRCHDLRHSTASYLAMQGKSLTEVGALLGHKQAQTTARYSHLAKSHLSKIAADLNDQLFGDETDAGEGESHA